MLDRVVLSTVVLQLASSQVQLQPNPLNGIRGQNLTIRCSFPSTTFTIQLRLGDADITTLPKLLGSREIGNTAVEYIYGPLEDSDDGSMFTCDDLNGNTDNNTLDVLYIEGHNVVFDPSSENSTVVVGGTAFFTCVPKVNGVLGLATWSIQPIGAATAVLPGTDNTTNLPGASGVYLSPDRTQLIITGVQKCLHLTSVLCRGTDADATLSPVPADIVYILVQSALTPDGLVSLYSGSQQTFTCNVTVAAGWNISGLSGISVTGNSGLFAANNNPRITTTDTSGITPSSTIKITGFTAADNGGTIQCINLADNSVQGTAIISIVSEDLNALSPTLVLKIILPSQLAVVLVWSVPTSVADDIDGFVISVVMVTPSCPKTIQQTTVGKQVKAFAVYVPEKGASYQVTVYMTMNGLHSRPLTVEVNL